MYQGETETQEDTFTPDASRSAASPEEKRHRGPAPHSSPREERDKASHQMARCLPPRSAWVLALYTCLTQQGESPTLQAFDAWLFQPLRSGPVRNQAGPAPPSGCRFPLFPGPCRGKQGSVVLTDCACTSILSHFFQSLGIVILTFLRMVIEPVWDRRKKGNKINWNMNFLHCLPFCSSSSSS